MRGQNASQEKESKEVWTLTDTQYKKLHKLVHKLFPFLSDDELFSKVSKTDYKKFMNKLIKKYKLDDNELDEMYKIAKPNKI